HGMERDVTPPISGGYLCCSVDLEANVVIGMGARGVRLLMAAACAAATGIVALTAAGSATADPGNPVVAYAWGKNLSGQVDDGLDGLNDGNGGTKENWRADPFQVTGLPGDVAQVAGDDVFSSALLTDGTVWAWGYNADGELGDGTGQGDRPNNSVRHT